MRKRYVDFMKDVCNECEKRTKADYAPKQEEIEELLNRFDNIFGAYYAIVIRDGELRSLRHQVGSASMYKNLNYLYVSYRMTCMGQYAVARAILRNVYESLLIIKTAVLKKDDQLLEKWVQGKDISLNREVFRCVEYPCSPQMIKFWNDLCLFTHATVESWQSDFVYERHMDDFLCNYILIQVMIYMTYHVLNRYLLDNNLLQKIERGINWGKGNSFKKLREEMRVYLHAVKEQQNTEVKRVLTDFSKVWKFKE